MNKFRIWFVDDLLHNRLQEALKRSVGEHAECKVFPEPGEPIRLMEKAAAEDKLAEVLPDVALIDVNFQSRASTGIMADVPKEARGFVFAAELRHYAKDYKKDLAYKIYTGDEAVLKSYRWLYHNPFNDHAALLPISQKSSALDPFEIIDWAREETYKLVYSRLPYLDSNPRELCERLDKEKAAMETEWAAAWEPSRADFANTIRLKIDELVESWGQMISADETFGAKNVMHTDRLRKAKSSGAVIYALSFADGPRVAEMTRPVRNEALDFNERNADTLSKARRRIQRLAQGLTESDLFKRTIEPLFPFDAQEIKESANPETIVNALKRILNILSETLDHNYILMRAFKTVEVPDSGPVPDKVATTVFANACHRWKRELWKFDFPPPGPDDEGAIESLLAEEINPDLKESKRRVPLLRLPKHTRERIERDGAEYPQYPLFYFTKYVYPRRTHWEEVPADYIRRSLPGAEVTGPEGKLADERVLTDWRRFFDPAEGIVAQILAAEEEHVLGVKSVRVDFDDDCKTVLIDLDFLLEEGFYFRDPIDLTRPGGALCGILKHGFLGWGQILIHTNTKNACYVTPWPGGEHKDEKGDTSRGVFRIEWSFRNYLRTRCPE